MGAAAQGCSVIEYPWRVGKSIGRTIYAVPPGASYRDGEAVIAIGLGNDEDAAAVAAHIVELHNWWLNIRRQGEAIWEEWKKELYGEEG